MVDPDQKNTERLFLCWKTTGLNGVGIPRIQVLATIGIVALKKYSRI